MSTRTYDRSIEDIERAKLEASGFNPYGMGATAGSYGYGEPFWLRQMNPFALQQLGAYGPQIGQPPGGYLHPFAQQPFAPYSHPFAQAPFAPYGQLAHPLSAFGQPQVYPQIPGMSQFMGIPAQHPSVFGQPVYGQPFAQPIFGPQVQQWPQLNPAVFNPLGPFASHPYSQITSSLPNWQQIQSQPFLPQFSGATQFQNPAEWLERIRLEGVGQRGTTRQGRGPKNFRRADDRIKDEISERLALHPIVDASEMEVIVKDGEVTLRGTVEDRYTKRLAEDIAESVFGVRDVLNEVRVNPRFGELGTTRESEYAGTKAKEK